MGDTCCKDELPDDVGPFNYAFVEALQLPITDLLVELEDEEAQPVSWPEYLKKLSQYLGLST